jgi:hypothetical protein
MRRTDRLARILTCILFHILTKQNGSTCLYLASEYGHFKVVEYLANKAEEMSKKKGAGRELIMTTRFYKVGIVCVHVGSVVVAMERCVRYCTCMQIMH